MGWKQSLEAWHNRCIAMNMGQDEQVQLLVDKYVAILNGEPPNQGEASASVLRGPWKSEE